MTAWDHDQWVKLYRQDSADWLDWSWQARALFCFLLRKVDRDGCYPVGKRDPAKAIGRLVDMPEGETRNALKELQATDTVLIGDGSVCVPNYTRAHPKPLTGAERTRRWRERQAQKSDGRDAGDGVTHSVTCDADREIDREIERKTERTIARARESGRGADPHLQWNQLAAELTALGPLSGGPQVNWAGPPPKAYGFALELMGGNASILKRLSATHRRLSATTDRDQRKWFGRLLFASEATVERLAAEPLEGEMQPAHAKKSAVNAASVLGDGWDA